MNDRVSNVYKEWTIESIMCIRNERRSEWSGQGMNDGVNDVNKEWAIEWMI